MKKIIFVILMALLSLTSVNAINEDEYKVAKEGVGAEYATMIDKVAENFYKEGKAEEKLKSITYIEKVYSKKNKTAKDKFIYNVVRYFKIALEKELEGANVKEKEIKKDFVKTIKYEKLEDHTFKIIDLEENKNGGFVYKVSSGSAVLFDENKFITNAHVILKDEEKDEFSKTLLACENINFEEIPTCNYLVKVVAYNKKDDLAILEIIDNKNIKGEKVKLIPGIKFEDEDVSLGEELYAYGFPGIGGENITFTKGVVSGINKSGIKTDAVIDHGNSGGPAFNKDKKIVGIIYAGVTENNTIGYIIPSKKVQNFIKESKKELKNNTLNNYSKFIKFADITNKLNNEKPNEIDLRGVKIKGLFKNKNSEGKYFIGDFGEKLTLKEEDYIISFEVDEILRISDYNKSEERDYFKVVEAIYLGQKGDDKLCKLDYDRKVLICKDSEDEELYIENISLKSSIKITISSDNLSDKKKKEILNEYYNNIENNHIPKKYDADEIKIGDITFKKELYEKYYVTHGTDNYLTSVINIINKDSTQSDYSNIIINTGYSNSDFETYNFDEAEESKIIEGLNNGMKKVFGDSLKVKKTEEGNTYYDIGFLSIILGKKGNNIAVFKSAGLPNYEGKFSNTSESIVYRYMKLGKNYTY